MPTQKIDIQKIAEQIIPPKVSEAEDASTAVQGFITKRSVVEHVVRLIEGAPDKLDEDQVAGLAAEIKEQVERLKVQ